MSSHVASLFADILTACTSSQQLGEDTQTEAASMMSIAEALTQGHSKVADNSKQVLSENANYRVNPHSKRAAPASTLRLCDPHPRSCSRRPAAAAAAPCSGSRSGRAARTACSAPAPCPRPHSHMRSRPPPCTATMLLRYPVINIAPRAHGLRAGSFTFSSGVER